MRSDAAPKTLQCTGIANTHKVATWPGAESIVLLTIKSTGGYMKPNRTETILVDVFQDMPSSLVNVARDSR